jgi:hypothetical protein
MQTLELTLTAPDASTAGDPAPEKSRGPSAPDGEFGRLMERALAPEEKTGADAKATPDKAKTPAAPGKVSVKKNLTVSTPGGGSPAGGKPGGGKKIRRKDFGTAGKNSGGNGKNFGGSGFAADGPGTGGERTAGGLDVAHAGGAVQR